MLSIYFILTTTSLIHSITKKKNRLPSISLTKLLVPVEEVVELEVRAVHLVVILVVGHHPVPVASVEIVLDHNIQVR